MAYKKVIFTKPKTVEISDYEISDPNPGEVQVRLVVSSISSGTERANILGEVNVSVFEKSEKAVFPREGGYSSAGIVEKVGEGVASLKVGDKVALSWSSHCQMLNISQENVHKLYEEISFEDAALFHIGTFSLAAIRKCRLEIGESAIVMGMGVLGLAALPLLQLSGASPIIAVDPMKEKREKALQCGADYALDPYAPDFAETVKGLTDGGVNVAIEVTGIGKALDSVLDCMARHGRVALLGCTRNSDFTIDYYHKVHGTGVMLVGAHTSARPLVDSSNGWWTQKDDVKTLMKLTRYGRLNLASMIDEVYSPMNAEDVYSRLMNETTFPMVQFDWRNM